MRRGLLYTVNGLKDGGSIMTIEQRLDQLEKRNKRLTATPMLLPLALCAVLTLSGLPTEIQAQDENTQSIGFVAGSTHGIGVS